MEQLERETILEALEETRWNRTAAAKKLGMRLRSCVIDWKSLALSKELSRFLLFTRYQQA
jgi:two-component system response regulator PilR (NtrC family)